MCKYRVSFNFRKVSIVIAGLLVSANAFAHDFEEDGIYYNIISETDRTVEVTYKGNDYLSYKEYSRNVIISATVAYNGDTYTVTSIGGYAFCKCDGLTSITIPNSVTSIGNSAFSDCDGLTSVIIPNSVTCIGSGAFNSSGLTSITIPNSVTSIGNSAFCYCTGLTSITIPNSVTSIGNRAFYYCIGLTSVTIPNSVTSIGDSAFGNCTGLTSISIPNSVTSIGDSAFGGCTGLTSISIPNSVTSIGDSAFSHCYGLTSVTIPNSVTSIGDSAFGSCRGLTSVTIDSSVTAIGKAFNYCNRLTSLTFGNSVTKIAMFAFDDFEGLTSVTIGNSITSIGVSAFGHKKIAKVIWLTNTPPSGYTSINAIVNYVANDQYSGLSNVKVYPYLSSMFEVDGIKYVPVSPSERTCDAIDCIFDSIATNINIRNTVSFNGITMTLKNINPCTFYNNYFIKSVNIDFDGNEIPDYCFYGCSSLPEITIPSNVTSIGDYVFDRCTSLANVTIEDRDTELSLGSNGSSPMFSACPLKTVYIGGNISYPTSSSYGYSPFYRNTTLETVTITDKETEISENEFYGCSSLKNITMGDGVESIGNWAFSGCSSLDYFSFGTGMKTIGEEAFSDCTAMTKLISNATVPPTCGSQALDDINKWNCGLFVPAASISAYQTADQWKEFFFISDTDAGVDGVNIDGKEAEEMMRYDIHGRLLSEPVQGINIVKMSDGSVRKVQVK